MMKILPTISVFMNTLKVVKMHFKNNSWKSVNIAKTYKVEFKCIKGKDIRVKEKHKS